MKIIFGIGNPGRKYKWTRHNIGFEVIDKFNLKMRLEKNWLYGEDKDNLYRVIKPLCFVNESGIVAKEVIETYNIELKDFLVVLDDFSLPFGKMRMKASGSSAGHKGLESIIYHLETEKFSRLRIGIGPKIEDATSFVLSKFTKEERKELPEIIDRAIFYIKIFITEGIEKAMTLCNTEDD